MATDQSMQALDDVHAARALLATLMASLTRGDEETTRQRYVLHAAIEKLNAATDRLDS